jgi:hypothetical protein
MEVLVELCYVHTVLYGGQEGRAAGSLGHTVVISRLFGVGSPGHMLPVKLRHEIKTDKTFGSVPIKGIAQVSKITVSLIRLAQS